MSTFEMIVTGLMAWGFVFHIGVLLIAQCGPLQHEVTDWCRRVILVAPTRRTLEIWQDWLMPVVYLAMAVALYMHGWKAAALFTLLAGLTCVLRSVLMHRFPNRNYHPRQLHPLCQWM
jgi:hypothetical protein